MGSGEDRRGQRTSTEPDAVVAGMTQDLGVGDYRPKGIRVTRPLINASRRAFAILGSFLVSPNRRPGDFR
jgi:hypothetical protein